MSTLPIRENPAFTPSFKRSTLVLKTQPKPWKPHGYQITAIRHLLTHNGAGLFLGLGIGKTAITLAAIKILKQQGLLHRVLVVSLLRPMSSVWPSEIQKWADFNGLRYQILHGPHKDAALEEDADIYLINPDGFRWLTSEGRFKKLNADTLVVDESSVLKHANTLRFKLLRPLLTAFMRRWILTATPNPNGYLDLFGQLYIVDLGKSLGRFMTHYRMKYFYPTGFGGYEWKLQDGAAERIQDAIKPYILRLDNKDYLDLPETVDNIVRVELPPKARKAYDEMEKELFTELDSGEKAVALSAGSAMSKCSQIANGALYHNEAQFDPDTPKGKRTWELLHSAKTDVAKELFDELQGSPLLIVYEYLHDLERLQKVFGANLPYIGGGVTAKRSKEIEDDWNAGRLPVMAGQWMAISHGLNLQSGPGQHIMIFSITYNLELYLQLKGRMIRQGSRHKHIFVHHLVASHTVDEAKMRALKSKNNEANGLLDALKEYRNSKKTKQI